MNLFVIAAGAMAVILLVAGWQRPRLAVLVAAVLWPLYAIYERLVATGVLCDADCNIRVDLVFLLPILIRRNSPRRRFLASSRARLTGISLGGHLGVGALQGAQCRRSTIVQAHADQYSSSSALRSYVSGINR
jgi:hypothetical protein